MLNSSRADPPGAIGERAAIDPLTQQARLRAAQTGATRTTAGVLRHLAAARHADDLAVIRATRAHRAGVTDRVLVSIPAYTVRRLRAAVAMDAAGIEQRLHRRVVGKAGTSWRSALTDRVGVGVARQISGAHREAGGGFRRDVWRTGGDLRDFAGRGFLRGAEAVSYTHLTLPTNREV